MESVSHICSRNKAQMKNITLHQTIQQKPTSNAVKIAVAYGDGRFGQHRNKRGHV